MKQRTSIWKNKMILEIKGDEQERFINICTFHRIRFEGVMEKSGGICCQIGLKDFKTLYELRHKADVNIRIIKKCGPYFRYRKNKKRKAAYLFAGLAFSMLYVFSLFIWDISFEGNVRYTDSFLIDFVKEAGYHPGMKIDKISCSELEKVLRNAYDDITWVSAMIDGTRLVISIKENTDTDVSPVQTGPSDLYAAQSGIITRMVTRTGVPMVKVGDIVEKGDMLVCGSVPIVNDSGETDHYLYRQASADVWIQYETWYEHRVNRRQSKRIYHKDSTRDALIIMGKRIALPIFQKEENTEVYIEQYPARLFENFYLPFGFERITYREYTDEMSECSDEELRENANEVFLDFLNDLDKIGVEIIENNVTIDINEEFCLMKGTLIVEENAVYEVFLNEEKTEAIGDR